jgi:hypothetical protein
MYLTVCAAGIRGLWNEVNRVKLLVAGSAGILISGGAVFGAVYKASSPLDTVPWVLAGWIAIGVIWSLVVTGRKPAPVTDPALPSGGLT